MEPAGIEPATSCLQSSWGTCETPQLLESVGADPQYSRAFEACLMTNLMTKKILMTS
jgi:hypothetical protein